MKPNSFTSEKITRAKAAVKLYKVDKILTPDYIIDSGEFVSTLRPKRYTSSSNSTQASAAIQKKQLKLVSAPSSVQAVKSLVKCSGKVKAILNDNFGLLEFYQDDANISYCLFDTFDLYLEGSKTAAQSKLTVANVLALDMEVCFHACEISPGSSVPWLANGVWRPDTDTHPKPVPHSKISKEKVAVFMKVAESCSVLVSEELIPSNTGSDETSGTNGTNSVMNNSSTVDEGDLDNNHVETVDLNCSKFAGEIEKEVEIVEIILPRLKVKSENGLENLGCHDKIEISSTVVNSSPEVTVEEEPKVKLPDDPRMEDLEVGKMDKPTVVGDLNPADDLSKTESSDEIGNDDKSDVKIDKSGCGFDKDKFGIEENAEESEVQVKKEEFGQETTNVEHVFKTDLVVEDTSPPLPELLSDQNTLGTLYQELGHKFAILALDSPVGVKALLQIDRIWVTDHPMFEGVGWEVLSRPSEQGIRVNARKVAGFQEFDYQVTFAHVGVSAFNVEMGEFSYTPDLAKFSEKKQGVEMLDSELETLREEK